MSVHGCINQVMNDSEEDDDAPIVFRRPNSSSKQGQTKIQQMSVHGCINQVMNDSEEDDDAPIVFRRPNSSSKQGHSTSALKKTNPQKDSSCNLVSHQIARNGSTSHSHPETSREKPTAAGSNVGGSLLPVQSTNSSHHKLTTTHMRPKHEDELSDSDDDKPLSHRRNSASTIVQRKSSMDSEKAHTHSSVHKLEGRSTEKMDLDDLIIKHENFDDDEPLSFKYSTSRAVNRSASSHAAKAPQSQKPPSLPQSMKPTSNYEETDDSEDGKPLLSRFQSNAVNGSGKKGTNSKTSAPRVGEKRPHSDFQLEGRSTEKIDLDDLIIKHENFDDDKPLSFKYSTSGAVNRSASSHASEAPLVHNGVIFPPPYKPHGIKMLYKGQPVYLTPEQEEVATMFAVMKDTDYAQKKQFIEILCMIGD